MRVRVTYFAGLMTIVAVDVPEETACCCSGNATQLLCDAVVVAVLWEQYPNYSAVAVGMEPKILFLQFFFLAEAE